MLQPAGFQKYTLRQPAQYLQMYGGCAVSQSNLHFPARWAVGGAGSCAVQVPARLGCTLKQMKAMLG
jgi:hypothetical protein